MSVQFAKFLLRTNSNLIYIGRYLKRVEYFDFYICFNYVYTYDKLKYKTYPHLQERILTTRSLVKHSSVTTFQELSTFPVKFPLGIKLSTKFMYVSLMLIDVSSVKK